MHILTAQEVFAQRDRENPYKDHARQFQKAGSNKARRSATVAKELEDQKTRLSDSIRQLGEAEALRVELTNSLDVVTARVASMRAEGCHESKLHEYVGYDFLDKADRKIHNEGSIEIMTGELERLGKRIALLSRAVNNPSTAENISTLETELAEAKRLERLGLGA